MSAPEFMLTSADRALLHARKAWGRLDDERFWSIFAADWRQRLEAGWQTQGAVLDRSGAREALQAEHQASARPDLARTHPTWWVRGLQDEAPAVQRAIAAHGPESVPEAVKAGLALSDDDVQPTRAPHPDAVRWALQLWPERLVGEPDRRPEDPPAILAMTQLDRLATYRLVAVVGLAKLSQAISPGQTEIEGLGRRGLRLRDWDRIGFFQNQWANPDQRLTHLARIDLASAHRAAENQVLHRLGLITIARLLTPVEPHRVRWALQHMPYSVAKFVRSRMGLNNPLLSGKALLAWEGALLKLAARRLRGEGRLGPVGEDLT